MGGRKWKRRGAIRGNSKSLIGRWEEKMLSSVRTFSFCRSSEESSGNGQEVAGYRSLERRVEI